MRLPKWIRSRWVTVPVALVAFTGMCWLAYVGSPGKSAWLPECVFHRVTGLHCPGCGNTRALHALVHGDLAASLSNNILLLPALLLLAVLLIWPRLAINQWVCLTVAVVVIAFFILRNVPLFPFTLLAPVS